MRTIWKFPLIPAGEQEIFMPHSAEILSAQLQPGITAFVSLWVIVETDHGTEKVTIEMFETGKPIPEPEAKRQYITTLQFRDGVYVVHVFKRL